jgi:hypothetical protein
MVGKSFKYSLIDFRIERKDYDGDGAPLAIATPHSNSRDKEIFLKFKLNSKFSFPKEFKRRCLSTTEI